MSITGFLSRDQVRSFDRHAIDNLGVPSLTLMENAGLGAAELLVSLAIHGPVLICCGKGNNAGDGFVIARHLHLLGMGVRVCLCATPEEMSADARINFKVLESLKGMSILRLAASAAGWQSLYLECNRAQWVVDALFGTGLTGPVRPPFDQIVNTINASTAKVFSVDIPSGLDCDSGRPLGPTIRARHTATFVAPKIGFANAESIEWTGKVHVIPIGVKME